MCANSGICTLRLRPKTPLSTSGKLFHRVAEDFSALLIHVNCLSAQLIIHPLPPSRNPCVQPLDSAEGAIPFKRGRGTRWPRVYPSQEITNRKNKGCAAPQNKPLQRRSAGLRTSRPPRLSPTPNQEWRRSVGHKKNKRPRRSGSYVARRGFKSEESTDSE